MKITVLTLFPQMIKSFFEESIIKRAQDKGLVDIEIVNIRDFAKDSYGSVDDKPYGGGTGMVMRVDILDKALKSVAKNHNAKVILTSAKGKAFDQRKAREYAKLDHLILIAGHYEGVDERVVDFIDEEVSIGDFVMTGGEIAAAAIVDAVVRLIPDVLKKEDATILESFLDVDIEVLLTVVGRHEILTQLQKKGIKKVRLLEHPHYTRPETYEGKKVPHVLMGGNHKEIDKWRLQKAYEETLQKRPDLLDG